MRVGIIGAGHAGVEAAAAARQASAEVVLFSNEDILPYFRPRLVSVAMREIEPAAIAMHPADWYASRGIELRLGTPVSRMDAAARRLKFAGGEETFDSIVLACGAAPVRPVFHGETAATPVFTLWCVRDALAVRERVRPSARAVIVGGGILGIECALRGVAARMQVTVVERVPRLLPLLLGERASALLRRQLEDRAIAVRTGRTVTSITDAAENRAEVRLDDGERLDADLVLACIGSGPNLTLARHSGLPVDRGVLADARLQFGNGCFVAGDVAQADGRPARGAVREATAQGRLAGTNAAVFAAGGAPQPFAFGVVPVSARHGGVEIHATGSAGGPGVFEQRLDDASQPDVYRAITRRDGIIVGVQMIGSREGFDTLAAQIP